MGRDGTMNETDKRWLQIVLLLALLATPLAIALVWGTYLDDDTYVTFRHARALAAGGGFAEGGLATGEAARLETPLFAFALSLVVSVTQ